MIVINTVISILENAADTSAQNTRDNSPKWTHGQKTLSFDSRLFYGTTGHLFGGRK